VIDKRIGIIGCGNMGEAILCRLLSGEKRGAALRLRLRAVSESNSSRRVYIRKIYGIRCADDNAGLVKDSDVIIIAVKPKDFDMLLKEIRGVLSKDKLLISIAAGITSKHIETLAGKSIPVIRIMPNMPAITGEAISAVSPGRHADKESLKVANDIFSSIGEVIEVDERSIDAVTAVSGSGPAYLFYFMEALLEAAREIGLSDSVAKRLIFKTVSGSSRLPEVLNMEPEALRRKVTSKGGTTEAAIKIFESSDFKGMVKRAVKEAYKRARELSKE